jgi:hypothetical protein
MIAPQYEVGPPWSAERAARSGLIRQMVKAKCLALFVGLESFDHKFLQRYNKKQNISRRHNIMDDIAFAEGQGIAISYGYLFDPRCQTAAEMEKQMLMIANNPLLPMPIYLSLVAPLAGTASFWADLSAGQLAANLRLRDLEGATIGYGDLADPPEVIVSMLERLFQRPWTVVGRVGIVVNPCGDSLLPYLNPICWYIIAGACTALRGPKGSPSRAKTYLLAPKCSIRNI